MRDKKLTVLVASLGHGGAEKVCLTLCNELIKRSYEIEVWVVVKENTSLIPFFNKQIEVLELNKKNTRSSFFTLIKLFIVRRPGKLLIFHIELALIAIVIKKMFFFKTSIYVRSINTLTHSIKNLKKSFRSYMMLKLIKLILPYSNKIIAQSTGMQQDLKIIFNNKESKITTIFNPSFHIQGKMNSLKLKHLENDFLFVGSFKPQKGLINLIRSFKMAYEKNKNIRLTLVGDGEEKKKLMKEVQQLGLNSCVTFEGYRENTLPYFKRAKATLLTSFFEGFPNVLVESIAAGTPVIAFNLPSGPDDIIVPGINGTLVDHLNLEGFSKAILDVANGEVQFSKEKVIETSKRFALDKIVSQYEKVLLEN